MAKKHDAEGALSELKKAAALAPDRVAPHYYLATLPMGTDPKAALTERRIAERSSGDQKITQLCDGLAAHGK